MREWRSAVWDSVPADAVPEHFEERLALLTPHVRAGQRVLDLGCGDGRFAAAMAALGAEVVCADVAAEALRRTGQRVPGAALVELADGAPLPFDDRAFDLVWAGETLEHVADLTGLLTELRRVLEPGGSLVITTPNLARLRVVAEALRGRPLEKRLDPRADHLRFFTARTLRGVLGDAGFAGIIVRVWGGLPLLRQELFATARPASVSDAR